MTTSCPSDPNSFLTTSLYLRIGFHLITILSVPLSIYGVYCIIYITPKQMSNAKWPLLNVQIWSTILDVILNVVMMPMVFFPSASIVLFGLGGILNISARGLVYIVEALTSVFASAVIALFENRQNSVETRWKIRSRWIRWLLNLFNYCLATIILIPPYLRPIDQEGSRLEILREIPCPSADFFNSRLTVFTDNAPLITLLMGVQALFYVTEGSFFVSHTLYHLVFVHSSRVSSATKQLQLRFLIGSVSQVSIPIGVIILPVFYIWMSINTGYYNQEINNHATLIFSCHNLLTTFCMLAVHKAYRTHFLGIFRRILPWRGRANESTIATVIVSRTS